MVDDIETSRSTGSDYWAALSMLVQRKSKQMAIDETPKPMSSSIKNPAYVLLIWNFNLKLILLSLFFKYIFWSSQKTWTLTLSPFVVFKHIRFSNLNFKFAWVRMDAASLTYAAPFDNSDTYQSMIWQWLSNFQLVFTWPLPRNHKTHVSLDLQKGTSAA